MIVEMPLPITCNLSRSTVIAIDFGSGESWTLAELVDHANGCEEQIEYLLGQIEAMSARPGLFMTPIGPLTIEEAATKLGDLTVKVQAKEERIQELEKALDAEREENDTATDYWEALCMAKEKRIQELEALNALPVDSPRMFLPKGMTLAEGLASFPTPKAPKLFNDRLVDVYKELLDLARITQGGACRTAADLLAPVVAQLLVRKAA